MGKDNNLEIILSSTYDSTEITIFGIKLGDDKDKINADLISKESLISRGNWIYTDTYVSFRINESTSTVVQFMLKETAFEQLKILTEEDIISKLGQPAFTKPQGRLKYFFYPSKKIVISFVADEMTPVRLFIGENIIHQTEFRISDFLDKFLEFEAMVKMTEDITAEGFRDNPPRYYRFMQLMSLLKAFDIGSNLYLDVLKGGFLLKRTEDDFKLLYKEFEDYIRNVEFKNMVKNSKFEDYNQGSEFQVCNMNVEFKEGQFLGENREIDITVYIGHTYERFMRFCIKMSAILGFNSGYLEAGYSARYVIYTTNQILNTFDPKKLGEIRILLENMLDPQQKTISREELVKKYNFPDVDLEAIDLDWY